MFVYVLEQTVSQVIARLWEICPRKLIKGSKKINCWTRPFPRPITVYTVLQMTQSQELYEVYSEIFSMIVKMHKTGLGKTSNQSTRVSNLKLSNLDQAKPISCWELDPLTFAETNSPQGRCSEDLVPTKSLGQILNLSSLLAACERGFGCWNSRRSFLHYSFINSKSSRV